MSERMIVNRIKKLRELERQQDALQEEIDRVKGQIQKHMENEGVDELEAGGFIVRWKSVISRRFDSKALKADLPLTYEQYTRQQASRRFTIA